MSGLFNGCSLLKSLPDISKWNTSKIEYMTECFMYCSSLLSLPDISKWNTKNVKDMKDLFTGCKSLISIPDISIWKTDNLIEINNIFKGCSSLLFIPDISKWNYYKITNNKNILIDELQLSANSLGKSTISFDCSNNISNFSNNSEKSISNDIIEYKNEYVDFNDNSENKSLDSYYENFYKDI